MNEFEKVLPAEGSAEPAQKLKKSYEISSRDRYILMFAFAFGVLWADTILFSGTGAACAAAVVFAWCALLLACTGPEPLLRRSNLVLLLSILFLALALALGSSAAFRSWNKLILFVLLSGYTVAAVSRRNWWQPAMLGERIVLLARGLFGNLGAVGAALSKREKARDLRKILSAAAGALGALVLLAILIPVLASADTLFAVITGDAARMLQTRFSSGLRRVVLALVLTPFLFGLLYSLRHPAAAKEAKTGVRPQLDSLTFTLMLAALDVLYLLFLAVQSAGIFGGPEYLAEKGISYAEWARSGFFQMVGVTALNLTVLWAALSLSRRAGRCWTLLRILSAALIGESLVLLGSAAWRMTLYVSAYGLSFKRCMTYWGMVMMALLFLLVLCKVRKPDFTYCRIAFPLLLAGWLIVNCIPIDYLVAKDQVDRYLEGRSDSISVEYLVSLSYDTLHQLDRLSGMIVTSPYSGEVEMESLLTYRRELAARECADWHSWSLSAWLVCE